MLRTERALSVWKEEPENVGLCVLISCEIGVENALPILDHNRGCIIWMVKSQQMFSAALHKHADIRAPESGMHLTLPVF